MLCLKDRHEGDQPAIFIGTSGWTYKHWLNRFYPAQIRKSNHLRYYAGFFTTVEVNNSFYRLPDRSVFKRWKKEVPDSFIFSVKASRYITHMKKLKECGEPVKLLMKQVRGLGKNPGPILFQLPPGWKINKERLHEFLKLLPRSQQFVFEFRNALWYDQEVYAMLKKFNCAFCIYELDGHISPIAITADFVYIRLHGPGAKYQGNYSDDILNDWTKRINAYRSEGKNVYVYFDNDQNAYAAFNARTLRKLTGV